MPTLLPRNLHTVCLFILIPICARQIIRNPVQTESRKCSMWPKFAAYSVLLFFFLCFATPHHMCPLIWDNPQNHEFKIESNKKRLNLPVNLQEQQTSRGRGISPGWELGQVLLKGSNAHPALLLRALRESWAVGHHHLQTAWPWADHLTSLCFVFLIHSHYGITNSGSSSSLSGDRDINTLVNRNCCTNKRLIFSPTWIMQLNSMDPTGLNLK